MVAILYCQRNYTPCEGAPCALSDGVGRLTAEGFISFPQRLDYQFAIHGLSSVSSDRSTSGSTAIQMTCCLRLHPAVRMLEYQFSLHRSRVKVFDIVDLIKEAMLC